MNREQKIKALKLIEQGTPAKKAVEQATMPQYKIAIGIEEYEALKASGYPGELFYINVIGADLPFATCEDEIDLDLPERFRDQYNSLPS